MSVGPDQPRAIAFDPFAISQWQLDALQVRPLRRSLGRVATSLQFGTTVTGHATASSIYACPAVILHRRGRRQLNLLHGGPAVSAPARDGLVSLIPAGWEVKPNYREPCEGVTVGLSAGLLREVAGELGTAADFPARAGLDDPELEALCEAFGRLSGRPRLADSLGRAVAVHLLERYAAPAAPAVGWLARSLAHIDAHLAGPVSVDELATAAGMSRAHFSREFKRATGDGPHGYLVARRVDRAKELLRADARMPLAEVAAEVGFCDQSHFTGHFRRRVGMTPGEFRAAV